MSSCKIPPEKRNGMWFLGFSTSRGNLWIVGAIVLVILVTVMLMKLTIYLEMQAMRYSEGRPQGEGDHEQEPSRKSCSLWCNGVVRTYALEELKKATRDFRISIGVGATSVVYLAELGGGKFGAVKRVMEEKGGSKKIFLDEVSVLLRISHPNLVCLLGFCLEKGEQLLLLEYVPNKSLFERMHTHNGQRAGVLSWSNRLNIALGISKALHYLHSQADPPIIHRDIKSSNILLLDDDHAKLADFGLCKLGYDNFSPSTPACIKGSLGYIDASYLKTGFVSRKSDVYSFGVLLLELITGLKSTQGPATLAEWTEDCRKIDDVEIWAKILDPNLKGEANLEQLRTLVHVANAALVENPEGRPEMSHMVDTISSCMHPHPQPQPHLNLPV